MAVVRVREAGIDDYGDPIEGDPDELTLTGAFTAPRTSVDIDGRSRSRDGAVVGLSLFAVFGADVVRTDKIVVDGTRYEIDGDIGKWESPFTGWRPGLVADLVRAQG